MKNIEMNNRIKHAVSNAVPDVLDNILSSCDNEGGIIMLNNTSTSQKRKSFKAIIGVAAALVLAVGVGSFGLYSQGFFSNYTVGIDVNPSIELAVNHAERIVSVNALNQDAAAILGDMDLKNANMDVAVNAIMGSMLKNGYIDELANSVLITVESKNEKSGDALREKLTADVDAALKAQSINAAILSQTITGKVEKDLKEQAAAGNISLGRAELIHKIISQNNTLKFDDLAKLTVNELNILASKNSAELSNVTTSGAPSVKAYIGEDKAMQMAFAKLGLSKDKVSKQKISVDYENGKMCYDLEFYSDGKKYEYNIDAITGEAIIEDDKDDELEDENDKLEDEQDKLDDLKDEEEDAADALKDAEEDAAEKLEDEQDAAKEAAEKAEDEAEKLAEEKKEAEEAAADKADAEKDAAEDAKEVAAEKEEAETPDVETPAVETPDVETAEEDD